MSDPIVTTSGAWADAAVQAAESERAAKRFDGVRAARRDDPTEDPQVDASEHADSGLTFQERVDAAYAKAKADGDAARADAATERGAHADATLDAEMAKTDKARADMVKANTNAGKSK